MQTSGRDSLDIQSIHTTITETRQLHDRKTAGNTEHNDNILADPLLCSVGENFATGNLLGLILQGLLFENFRGTDFPLRAIRGQEPPSLRWVLRVDIQQ